MSEDPEWCPRCAHGYRWPDGICRSCWEGTADGDVVRRLVELQDSNSSARDNLGRITDPRAVPALLALAADERGWMRLAAIASLGWSGDASCVSAIVPGLADPSEHMRRAARLALAELGGAEAVAALRATLDGTIEDREQRETIDVLAWLGDRRVLPAAQAIHAAFVARPRMMDSFRMPGWAIAQLATPEELDALVEEAVADTIAGTSSMIRSAIGTAHPERLEALREGLAAVLGDEAMESRHWYQKPQRMLRPGTTEPQLLVPRTVPCLRIVALSETPDPDAPDLGTPPARFGGQPDWIGEPQWPVSASGMPLVFHGQLPLPELPGTMAYIFYGGEEEDPWEPFDPGNAVIVQPNGAPCHLETRPLRAGPQIYREHVEEGRFSQPRTHRPYERFAVLRPGLDPEEFEREPFPEQELYNQQPPLRYGETDSNKIGGTPNWAQEPQSPGDEFRFMFQFAAGWASEELGNGAWCYGFVDPATRRGAILYQ